MSRQEGDVENEKTIRKPLNDEEKNG